MPLLNSRITLAMLACSLMLAGTLYSEEDIGLPDADPKHEASILLLKSGLKAWQAEDEGDIDNWSNNSGVLTNYRLGTNLMTKESFRDFDLQLEFQLPRKGNSGVYLRGRYEVQLNDDTQDIDLKRSTGAIWGQIPILRRAYKGPLRWNELAVRIKDRTVTVMVNRVVVIRSQKLTGPTREAHDLDEDEPGPILLQSLAGVRFRGIVIRPL